MARPLGGLGGGIFLTMGSDRTALVVFDIGGRRCALPAAAVREVVHYPELSRPPGMPGILEGFLNYGGSVLPVVRLGRLFGGAAEPPGLYAPILVLRGSPVALLVGAVRAVAEIQDGSLLPVEGEAVFNDCLAGQAEIGGEPVHVLLAERLLLAQERRRLDELAAQVAERLTGLEGGAA